MRGRFYDIFRHADRIQCISTYLADWAKAMGAIAPIDVVPNGVDLAKVSMALPDAERYKQEYKEDKVIITTSRLVPKNGIADLIKAMSYLPKDIKLQICGIGPEQDRLEALVRRLGLSNRVIFLGFIKGEEIFSYLAKADIFVRPSLSEGLGNSFLEAMALGLPTVGTPVGGIVDFLKDGETGWLANVSDPKSIAKKVSYILDPIHKDIVEQVVARGAEVVRERYDWDKVAGEMGKIFSELF